MSFSNSFSSEPWQFVPASNAWPTSPGSSTTWTSSKPFTPSTTPNAKSQPTIPTDFHPADWSKTWTPTPVAPTKKKVPISGAEMNAVELLARFAELSFIPTGDGNAWAPPPTMTKKSSAPIAPVVLPTIPVIPAAPATPPQLSADEISLVVGDATTEQTEEEKLNNIEEELSRQSLYKTELCRSFGETGICRYGHKCQFAHGEHEVRVILRHPKYKTENCKTFVATGTCPYGPRCRFIHPVAANAARPTQKWLSSWNSPPSGVAPSPLLDAAQTDELEDDSSRLAIFKNLAS